MAFGKKNDDDQHRKSVKAAALTEFSWRVRMIELMEEIADELKMIRALNSPANPDEITIL